MKDKKNRGITLIALVITIILLLILAGVSISAIGGENGIITQTIKAKEETERKQYAEKIELIKTELLLENRYKEPLTLAQLQERLSPSKEKWVASIEPIMDKDIEKLKLVTKEGYIFYITGTTTEYKGKGEVVDTSALDREDVIQIEKIEEGTTTVTVRITDLSGVNYYTLKYKIGDQGEWQQINSGETVEVPHGETIYAKLVYGSSDGEEHKLALAHAKPTVVAKNEDTTNLIRKTDKSIAELFEITWGSDGSSTNIEYIITGNLTFNNTSFNSAEIENISELELGTYTVTCKIISPTNQTAEATKENVKVTTLAETTVANTSNTQVDAKAIYSEYDFAHFRDLVNGGQFTLNAKLMNDIELTTVSSEANGGWIPIGNWDKVGNFTGRYFSGIFDGGYVENGKKKNHSVTVNKLSQDTQYNTTGLFGMTVNATIRNLTVYGDFSSKACMVGGIAGAIKNTTVSECINYGLVECGATWTHNWGAYTNYEYGNSGGICGYIEESMVTNCINYGEIRGNSSLLPNGICSGGIVGYEEHNSTIKICVNYGNVYYHGIQATTNGGCLGGIVGLQVRSTIEECFNEGEISSTSNGISIMQHIGGIVGYGNGVTIKNVYNIGKISGTNSIGGIAGLINRNTGITGSDKNTCYNWYDASESIQGNDLVGQYAGEVYYTTGRYFCWLKGIDVTGAQSNCDWGTVGDSYLELELEEMKSTTSGLLTLLNKGDGSGKWAQSANINNGLPYLINNFLD